MTSTSRSFVSAFAACAAILTLTSVSHAQPRYEEQPRYDDSLAPDNSIQGVRFEVHADLGFSGFLGAGFDVEIPVVPNGFLPSSSIRDEFALAPGIDLLAYDFRDGTRGVAFAPQITAQWNLYVHPDWSIFPEMGMAVFFVTDQYWYHDTSYRSDRRGLVDGIFAIGARRHFTDRVAVTMRIGWPFGAQAGVTF